MGADASCSPTCSRVSGRFVRPSAWIDFTRAAMSGAMRSGVTTPPCSYMEKITSALCWGSPAPSRAMSTKATSVGALALRSWA